MYNTIEECKNDEKLRYVNELFHNTQIHGGFVEYENDKGFVDSGIYLVASIKPISQMNWETKNPADIQRKIEGDPSTFYPYEFAIKVTDEDPLLVFDKVSEFCRKAEMLKVYFGLENVEVPREMASSDVKSMRIEVADSRNSQISGDMRECVRENLKKSIKSYNREVKKQNFAEKVSSKFKSKEQQIAEFIREHKQVNFETINEKQVDAFVDFLKQRDPELEYVLSDKISVKTGLEEIEEGEYDPYGYAERDHEYREVYFKRADEQLFQDAFNYIQFSKSHGKGHDIPLTVLAQQGAVCSVKIPDNYMWLVDQCLEKWNVPYAIDYGYLNKSESDGKSVPILYLERDKEIISCMTRDLCDRYARESYVHAYDKSCYNDKMKEQNNKKRRGRDLEL